MSVYSAVKRTQRYIQAKLGRKSGLSVQNVCDQLGVEIPASIKVKPSHIFSKVCFETDTIPGCLYILRAMDPDRFADRAMHDGAAMIVAEHQIKDYPCVIAEDPIQIAIDLSKKLYEEWNVPVALIAGSVGKTTTKYFVNAVLETKYRTMCNPANGNTFESLVMELQCYNKKAEFYVREVDESGRRSAKLASEILRPKTVIITNIDKSHIGNAGGEENLIRQITNVTANMDETGTVIINGDDERSISFKFPCKVVRCSLQNKLAECYAEHIVQKDGRIEFDLNFEGQTHRILIPALGTHNVYNAMMAFVIGRLNGVSDEQIKQGIANYKPMGYRQNIMRSPKGLIYADCYNASAKSVASAADAIDNIQTTEKAKRIAVIGDIAEIEGYEEEVYSSIGEILSGSMFDVLITYGKESQKIHEYVKNKGIALYHASCRAELHKIIKEQMWHQNNIILFKASRTMALEKSIQQLFLGTYIKSMATYWIKNIKYMIDTM